MISRWRMPLIGKPNRVVWFDCSCDRSFRVIKVFKSRLFQALMGLSPLIDQQCCSTDVFSRIDIQEFYESVLLDDQSDRAAKMNATLRLAEDWEHEPMLRRDRPVRAHYYWRTSEDSLVSIQNGATTSTNETSVMEPIVTSNPMLIPLEAKSRKPTQTPFSRLPGTPLDPKKTETHPVVEPTASTEPSPLSYADHWTEISIDLHRVMFEFTFTPLHCCILSLATRHRAGILDCRRTWYAVYQRFASCAGHTSDSWRSRCHRWKIKVSWESMDESMTCWCSSLDFTISFSTWTTSISPISIINRQSMPWKQPDLISISYVETVLSLLIDVSFSSSFVDWNRNR